MFKKFSETQTHSPFDIFDLPSRVVSEWTVYKKVVEIASSLKSLLRKGWIYWVYRYKK
jgi:hypothetical protein